jgi:hypothetical protein
VGELGEQVFDAFGLERGLVVHPAWPVGADPQRAALAVGSDGALVGVLPPLA